MSFFLLDLPILLGRSDLTINMILESGAPGSGDTPRIVAQVKKDLPNDTKTIGDVSFGEKATYPGLQVADFLAHGAFGMEGMIQETDGVPWFGGSPSPLTLEDVRRRAPAVRPPLFRSHLDSAALLSLKTDILDLVEYRQRYAVEVAERRANHPAPPG